VPPRTEGVAQVPIEPWMWVAFVTFILAMLALDLFVVHKDAHEVSFREAATWSIIWVALGLSFGILIWTWQGPEPAGQYLAGYLIEKSLSVDNIFVFALVFGYFAVPQKYQHRVLFWGILGALVFRAIFIFAGTELLDRFHWMIFVFGGFLVLTGIKMFRHRDEHVDPGRNPVLRVMKRFIPTTDEYVGQKLFVRRAGRLLATPLFAVLVVIETTDIIFAIDSIPAILAVTDDPFLVFTSNAFAILGLRALYFLLAGMMDRFAYLKLGLAAVLIFVGAKMLISDLYHVPIWASLTFIVATIGISIVVSLRKPPPDDEPIGHGIPVALPTTPSDGGSIRESMTER
jgi:tellurite resistance protein TerC